MTDVLYPQIDPDSAPFWKSLRKHRLAVQRCDACGTYRLPARPICHYCHSTSSSWPTMSGRGRITSWVVTHHVTHPAFARQLPYTVVYVELAEQDGLMVYGNLRPAYATVRHGLEVEAVFEDVAADLTLVQWRPVVGQPGIG